jgi:hypothetical protein
MIEIIAIVILAIVIVGEVVVYTTGPGKYSSDVEFDDGAISYSISAKGSETYAVIVADNADMIAMTEIYIYFDESYESNYEEVLVPIGAKPLNQSYYVEQLVKQLEYRGAIKAIVMNAEELAEALEKDLVDGDYAKGLVAISGALPDTVYQGNSTDTIFDWMNDGGRLYWLGNLIGSYYSTKDAVHDIGDKQMLFFGTSCLNTEGTDKAFSDVAGNGLRDDLSLMSNSVKYGIDPFALSASKGADRVLSFGYSQDNYASIVMTDYGKGMICVIGGDYSNNQRSDLAQILSSQICYKTEIVETITGSVTRKTITDTYDIQGTVENLAVYVYLGGYYSVYGNFFSFEA